MSERELNPFRLVLKTLKRVNKGRARGIGAFMRKCVLALDVVDMTRRTPHQAPNDTVLVGFLWFILDIVHGSCERNVHAIESGRSVDHISLSYLLVHAMYSATKRPRKIRRENVGPDVHRKLGMEDVHVDMIQRVLDDICTGNIRIDDLKTF